MKKIKFNSNIIYLMIVILVILMFIFGKRGGEEIEVLEEELISEESAGSGFLEVETFPDDAEIYVDRLYSGDSPTTLYNVPAGLRNIIIKKEGYGDFISDVSIEAGKKTFLEARLVLVQAAEEDVEIIGTIEEEAEVIEVVEEEIPAETPKADNMVNIGKGFLLYYDFSEGEFADKRNFEQDIFSKRYAKHLVFTRINPVNIKTIDKNIDDVEKGDCAGVKGQFEFLNSGQSLCVITKEGSIAAIGGTWDDTENAELKWKVFD